MSIVITGKVPCPALGEGAYIYFNMADLAKVEAKFGESWFNDEIISRVTGQKKSVGSLYEMALIGARDGRDMRIAADNPVILDPQAFMSGVMRPLVDACFISVVGMTPDEFSAKLNEQGKQEGDASEKGEGERPT
jgi:hypothetical protein